jgi:hypothetical protein
MVSIVIDIPVNKDLLIGNLYDGAGGAKEYGKAQEQE